jgi:dTDP-4-dehydrorhamnose reductase
LRTAWVYSPFGANFVRTMLRLNETRDEVGVVADQYGNPTSALDIADAVIAIATKVRGDRSPALRGLFHMTGSGEATWADLAEAVFDQAAARSRRVTRVKRIATADYPTPARRPANSRLDNEKLARVYGFRLPEWRQSAADCCDRLLS